MRILYVVPYVPSRTRVRSYSLMLGLAKRGHAVTLATLWQDQAGREDLDSISRLGIAVQSARLTMARSIWNCLGAVASGEPLQARFCWQPALGRIVRSEIESGRYDMVHVEHLRGARFGLVAARALRPVPVVWDAVDCISHLFEQSSRDGRGVFARVVTRLELPRTRVYEARMLRSFDEVVVTSPVDKAALEALTGGRDNGDRPSNGGSKVHVVPNGVDFDYFHPADEPPESDTLVYLGRMSYHANVAAVTRLVKRIMPLVWQVRPNTSLLIVGQSPSREVRALSAADPSRIVVTGSVPDVRPYLWRATAMVAPMVYGAGIQNKILEGMATGVPVVCTSPATAALQARAGEELLVEDSDAGFAAAVLRLLEDTGLRSKLGAAGRSYVTAHHDWAGAAARLETVYMEAIAARAGQHPVPA